MSWKKNLVRLSFVVGLLLLFFAFYGAGEQEKGIRCRRIEVSIADSPQLSFVTRERILNYLQTEQPDLLGTPIRSINTADLEQRIQHLSGVDEVQVYYGVDSCLRVDVWQREPLFRIVARSGRSCYVDRDGDLFPVDPNYTALVPVVSGRIEIPEQPSLRIAERTQQGLLYPDTVVLVEDAAEWDRLFHFINYLLQDELWRSLFSQVYIDSWQRVELIPRLGGQLIVLGTLDNFRYKLDKFYSLYKALLQDPVLEEYSLIDLQYSNQVICHRR